MFSQVSMPPEIGILRSSTTQSYSWDLSEVVWYSTRDFLISSKASWPLIAVVTSNSYLLNRIYSMYSCICSSFANSTLFCPGNPIEALETLLDTLSIFNFDKGPNKLRFLFDWFFSSSNSFTSSNSLLSWWLWLRGIASPSSFISSSTDPASMF